MGWKIKKHNQNILVYDLGGGTFDVSVVELFDGVVEVKSSAGNNNLGGIDFDEKIVEWIYQLFEKKHGYDLSEFGPEDEQLRNKYILKLAAEKAKKALSSSQTTKINIPFLGLHNNERISIDEQITREEFEGLINHLVQSTLEEVDKSLNDAKLSENEIDEVLLIGGSTRIPLIQKTVEEKFSKSPRRDINPDEAVALGAAVQGGIKSGQIDSQDGLMVVDVRPHTLGTEVVKNVGGQLVPGYFDPIIPRNSTIPLTEKKSYFTSNDDQESVSVKVYQGENQYVTHNTLLSDQIMLDGIPKRPAGEERIEVQFTYDINGILNVEATVISTGLKKKDVIKDQVGVMTEEQVKESLDKINQAWDESEHYSEVKNVILRAERVMDECEPEERARLQVLVSKMKAALSSE